MLKKLVYLSSAIALASAHSWVHCTKYVINEANQAELETYDNTKCKGFPRHFKDYDRGFGVDAGYNHQIDSAADTNAPCRTGFNDGTPYTAEYPMATYAPGERVCLTWPTKNHVASSCNNQYIPDGGVKIFRSGVNPTAQVTKAQYEGSLVVDMGATQTPANTEGQALYTRPGFQRCPKFCTNNDKAMCSQCFTVPANMPEGTYSFAWFWIFNPGQLYTSCWEAKVSANGASPTSAPSSPTASPTSSKPTPTPELAVDNIAFEKAPTVFSATEAFEVEIAYFAGGSRKIVVDILSIPDNKFYGNGAADAVAGKGSVKISVTPKSNPPDFQNYILKAWIVENDKYIADPTTAYLYELYRVDTPVTVGTKTVYSNSNSSTSKNGGIIAGAFFGGFGACAVILGIAFAVYVNKQGKV